MKLSRREFTLAALAAGCASPGVASADLIIHGGPIYTGAAKVYLACPAPARPRMREGADDPETASA